MSNGTTAIVAIVVIAIILVLFGSTIISELAPIGNSTLNSFSDFINRFILHKSTSANGYSAINFVVHFTDGSTQTYGPTTQQYSVAPLSIVIAGKVVQSVDIKIVLRLVNATGITNWVANVTQHAELYKITETVPTTSSTGSFASSGTSWANGEQKVLSQNNIPASMLEPLVNDVNNGGWKLQETASIKLSVTQNGITDSYTSTVPACSLEFTYTNGIPSLSVTSIEGALWK